MRKYDQLNATEQATAMQSLLAGEVIFIAEILSDGQDLPDYLEEWNKEFSSIMEKNETTPWFITECVRELILTTPDLLESVKQQFMKEMHNIVFLDKDQVAVYLS